MLNFYLVLVLHVFNVSVSSGRAYLFAAGWIWF